MLEMGQSVNKIALDCRLFAKRRQTDVQYAATNGAKDLRAGRNAGMVPTVLLLHKAVTYAFAVVVRMVVEMAVAMGTVQTVNNLYAIFWATEDKSPFAAPPRLP